MKKQILFLIFSVLTISVFAQPANDNCSGAQSLGLLAAPGPCGSGVQSGAKTTISGTNVNATPESPYVTLTGCSMASPANSVWYSFTVPATGSGVNIAITGATFSNPNIALWSGTCGALSGVGCIVGSAGAATLNIGAGMISTTTYYIQVSGNTGESGTFTMAVNSFHDCSNCLGAAHFTSISPSPTNGTYLPGQTVSFCFHVDSWTNVNTNWLHGIQLTFGNGWDLTTLTTTAPSPAYNCTKCNWSYYPSGITSSATGTTWPAGFYFDGNAAKGAPSQDANPGNNFGDPLGGGTTGATVTTTSTQWLFCWTIKVKTGCNPGMSLAMTVNTSGDGESGAWTSAGCNGDEPISFNAIIACCPPTATSTSTCTGLSTGTATANPVGSAGPYTYQWTPTGQTTQTATGLAAGTYTVTVIDKNLCVSSTTVTVAAVPGPTLTVNTPTVCAGTSATLTASGATSYVWSTGSSTSSTTVTPSTTTTYTLTGTSGCVATKTTTVTVNPLPVLNLASASICSGQSTTLTVSGASSYTWSGGSTGSTLSVTPVSNTTYTVTGTTGSCTSTATASVTIGSSMTISVNSPSICPGDNISLTASGATDYLWSSTETTTTINVSPMTTTSYTVTGSTSGCSGSAISTVTVGSIPTMSVNSSTICSGSSTSITASGATDYLWSTGETTATISINPSSTSTYTVTGTSSTGCTSTTTAEVLVNTLPNITGTATIVDDNCGTGVGSITGLSSTGTPTLTYTWSNSTPTIVSTSTTTGDLTNQTAGDYTLVVTSSSNTCFATAGPYTIGNTGGPPAPTATSPSPYCQGDVIADLTASGTGGTLTWYSDVSLTTVVGTGSPFASGVSNAGASVTTFYVTETTGCQGPATAVMITVNATPIASVSPNLSTVDCSTPSSTLTGVGGNTYSWSTTDNTTSITVTPTVSTTYTLTATSSAGCSATATAGVAVDLAPPALTVTPTGTIDCANPSAILTATGGNNYLWSNTNTNATINVTTAGVYTVTATGTNGCTATASSTVSSTAGPVASFTANPLSGTPPLTVTFTNTSSNASTYLWTFGDGNTTTTSTTTTPVTNIYTATGSYQVIMIASQGSCTDTASVTILVYDNSYIFVPNVFTPNGDNTNDLFTLTSKGLSTLDAEIYDRWGLMLYEWHTINGGWNGVTTSGSKSVDGTYFYIIKAKGADGKEYVEKGPFSLFR